MGLSIQLFNNLLSSPQTIKREDETKDSNIEVLRGEIVAILNKITPQNFTKLSLQILQLNIDNKDKAKIVADIIFDKAVLEPAISQTYAKLCRVRLSRNLMFVRLGSFKLSNQNKIGASAVN